jgi:hypothetical protein
MMYCDISHGPFVTLKENKMNWWNLHCRVDKVIIVCAEGT